MITKKKIIASALAVAMAASLTACSNGTEGGSNASSEPASSAASETSVADTSEDNTSTVESAAESSADTESEAESAAESKADASDTGAKTKSKALKSIFDIMVKDKDYLNYKGYFPNTKFEEKLDGDCIVIDISGTDEMNGTCRFPLEDGYIVCKMDSSDLLMPSIFTIAILPSIATYFDLNSAVLVGYTNAMSDTDNEYYIADQKEDGSGTIKFNIEKKPDLSVLDNMSITEDLIKKNIRDDTQSLMFNYGKILLSLNKDNEKNSVTFAIGEYGEENTDLTKNSIVSLVETIKPNGYEKFLNDFTELKEIKGDGYSVSFDSTAYAEDHGISMYEGYKFVVVDIG